MYYTDRDLLFNMSDGTEMAKDNISENSNSSP